MEAKSFKDYNGKKGAVGSKVVYRMIENVSEEDIQIVEKIWRAGAGGTIIKLTGGNPSGKLAKSYVIVG